MSEIPGEFHDLFERKTFANFATLMPDGVPQVTPVWVDYDAPDPRSDDQAESSGDSAGSGHVLINTVRGRRKEKNVRQNSKVGLDVLDPDDPYRYVSIRGEVVEVTEEGAVDHIDELARRYMDAAEYPHHGEEQGSRVIVRIRPDDVTTSG